jgi:hypothetical protein
MKRYESVYILRMGVSILALSILWYILAPKITVRAVPTHSPLEVDQRLRAVEKYQQDKSQNTFEYETNMLPPPLAGDRNQNVMENDGKVSGKSNE